MMIDPRMMLMILIAFDDYDPTLMGLDAKEYTRDFTVYPTCG
jgi:hypothetical protein